MLAISLGTCGIGGVGPFDSTSPFLWGRFSGKIPSTSFRSHSTTPAKKIFMHVPNLPVPFIFGCSLNWWVSPHFTPQVLIIFSRKTPWVCWGNPTILGVAPIFRTPRPQPSKLRYQGITINSRHVPKICVCSGIFFRNINFTAGPKMGHAYLAFPDAPKIWINLPQ